MRSIGISRGNPQEINRKSIGTSFDKHWKSILHLENDLEFTRHPYEVHRKTSGIHPKSIGNPLDMIVTEPLDILVKSIRNTIGIHLTSIGSPLAMYWQPSTNQFEIYLGHEIPLQFLGIPLELHWTCIRNPFENNLRTIGHPF